MHMRRCGRNPQTTASKPTPQNAVPAAGVARFIIVRFVIVLSVISNVQLRQLREVKPKERNENIHDNYGG